MDGQSSTPTLCIGERLAAARRDAGLSVSDIAARTKVSSHYITALETEAFERLPSRVHTVGFARAIAKAVSLDDQEISSVLRTRLDERRPPREQAAACKPQQKSIMARLAAIMGNANLA